jgi:hypothetical protein
MIEIRLKNYNFEKNHVYPEIAYHWLYRNITRVAFSDQTTSNISSEAK